MENTSRKASEVLLDLEKKLDIALGIIHVQDLNIKILSNKLNSIIELLSKQNLNAPKITVEAVNTNPLQKNSELEKNIPISSEFSMSIDNSPQGFRRSSRPETFSGDNAYLPGPAEALMPKFPTQMPKNTLNKAQTPPPGREPVVEAQVPKVASPAVRQQNIIQNAIPVSQRVVNKDGKSLFLADVEITDLQTMQSVFKTRTNGSGKWSASLGIGNYRIFISKRESSTSGRLSATQDIQIDSKDSKVELKTIIIKD